MQDVPEAERGFMVLLEEVQRDVKLLVDGHFQVDQKIDRVAKESLDRDLALDRKIDLHTSTLIKRMDEGFAAVAQELRAIRDDLGSMKSEFGSMKSELGMMNQELGGLNRRFDAHEQSHTS